MALEAPERGAIGAGGPCSQKESSKGHTGRSLVGVRFVGKSLSTATEET